MITAVSSRKPLEGVELRAYLDGLMLLEGGHSPDSQFCVMEAVAFVAGEKWSDHPECASPVIGEFMRNWNDSMSDDDRQMLKPYIPRLVNTAGTPEQELERSWMALDWHCRLSAPAWLRAAGLVAEAEAIEATAPIIDSQSAQAAQTSLNAASAKARAAGDAAWDAAVDAAGDAAWAAARDAAWAAARDAAVDAARDAARDAAVDAAVDAARAAARDAARAAARAAAWAAARAAAGDAAWDAARDALRPTVVALQTSALELLDRMIAVSAKEAA